MVHVPSLSAGDRVVLTQLRLAVGALALALVGGLIAVLHYIPPVATVLNLGGVHFAAFRPIHTIFAHAWIFGVNLAVIYHAIDHDSGGLSERALKRARLHTWLFIVAGFLAFATLIVGVTSGREYLGFIPLVSLLFLVGWIVFLINFFAHMRHGFWKRPVYVLMWAVGACYFTYTFIEGHAYLLPGLDARPVADLQVQWKSCGTLVGSMNFLVYGTLLYIGERMSGDSGYAQSRTAWWLFTVGCLNSFTNFAHHTYHLPQLEIIKWIAFVVSMLEIIIVLRVLWDINTMRRAPKRELLLDETRHWYEYDVVGTFLVSAKWWTLVLVFHAVLISIPPLNALIHGTHVVLGHGMGSEIGIDTMILLGAFAWLLTGWYPAQSLPRVNNRRTRWYAIGLNISAAILVSWLTLAGTVHGIARYNGLPHPLASWNAVMFPLVGTVFAVFFVGLMCRLAPLVFGVEARVAVDQTPPWER